LLDCSCRSIDTQYSHVSFWLLDCSCRSIDTQYSHVNVWLLDCSCRSIDAQYSHVSLRLLDCSCRSIDTQYSHVTVCYSLTIKDLHVNIESIDLQLQSNNQRLTCEYSASIDLQLV
jgi:hypothetical protein